jgi:hypothetical protein
MVFDLFGMILESAISWGVGRILDVLFTCDYCGQKEHTQIGNVQTNYLGCTNCSREIVQFTNACDFTVGTDGETGHVGAKLLGGYSVTKDPAEPSWLSKEYEGWLFFPIAARARDMLGKQFVVTGEVVDYNTGIVYVHNDTIYTPPYADSRWYDNCRMPLKWMDIPEDARDSRVFAIDLMVRSRYGDVLCEDRRLEQLWK